MNTKLSKTQLEVLTTAKAEIDRARSCETFEEYFTKYLASGYNCNYNTPEKHQAKDPAGYESSKGYWEREKQAITLTNCKTNTLLKLEQLGYIEIIENSNRQSFGIDTVKVLNY